MNTTKEKFIELYNFGREDNAWDYKTELEVVSKSQKYNLIKDLLAFSNFGGGHLVVGIGNDNKTIVGVDNCIDPANLGALIEKTIGYSIEFEINYFDIDLNGTIKKVGLIYIFPSTKICICPKDLHGEDGKTIIVRENDVLTRRDTRSIKANSEDYTKMNQRLYPKPIRISNIKIADDKYPIFLNEDQRLQNLWNALDNKIEINAEQLSINLRGIVWYSKHSKSDYARLIGIGIKEFDKLLKGEKIPSLDLLIRICKQENINIKSFFEPNYSGIELFWKSERIKFALLKLIKNTSDISKIIDINKTLGTIIYKASKNIISFYEWINNKYEKNSFDPTDIELAIESFNEISDQEKEKFKKRLEHQYYKLLEIVPNEKQLNNFTKQEELISNWFFMDSSLVLRVIVEAISEILIDNHGKPKICFHFWQEMIDKEIIGREYNEKDIKIEFNSDKKLSVKSNTKSIVAKDVDKDKFENKEYGVWITKSGKTKITEPSYDFFAHRISKAFPGVRGFTKIEDPIEAVKRLEILLRFPTQFDVSDKSVFFDALNRDKIANQPIWFLRGPTSIASESFKKLSSTKILLENKYEIEIEKIAIFQSQNPYLCFVYVEAKPEKNIGIYSEEIIQESIDYQLENRNFAYEIYALFNDFPVTYEEYNDGSAVINGEIVEIDGAECRVRYLTKYNFVIVAQASPLNLNEKVINQIDEFLNDILKSKYTVEDMANYVSNLRNQ
jgi:Putative DNA-binding domain